jgi:hypothetical protein
VKPFESILSETKTCKQLDSKNFSIEICEIEKREEEDEAAEERKLFGANHAFQ